MKRSLFSAVLIAAALFVSITATAAGNSKNGYCAKCPELTQCPQPMDGGDYV